ncbi:ZIP family metal transporter [Fodinibius halophilus]|uniref:ZIP family metal transporter n=1 Tax=Fodinibius halophilus TaxID=1736908 RepID=A0A6M1TFQ4_9BACT|nr:ZIP family metal transporter [Fodinibius halophilus]NGP88962.1 ZIP family metal transporter [Fodinibius halophilus]
MSTDWIERLPKWIWAVIPLALLFGAVVLFLVENPLQNLGINAPPVQQLTVEQTKLDDDGIHLKVRANGSEPVSLAQVMVDEAYWKFSMKPESPIPRLSSSWVTIPYPWVKDELHEITLLTDVGATFSHTIEVATPTPELTMERIWGYILLGIFIGVVPVALGLMFYPYLKTKGDMVLQFLLTLTLGLLLYLFIDTLQEGLELAEEAATVFESSLIVWLVTGLSFLLIYAVGRSKGKAPEGLSLATYLSIGIGLHNLGEGLAVGAALASGEAALGSFLVVGFTLHNLTEGIGIATPLLQRKTKLLTFVGLTLLAGLPAAAGTLIGAFSYSPQWGAVLFAVGAGAILQVIVEISSYIMRNTEVGQRFTVPNLAGFTLGIALMYGTALLVAV